MTNDDLRYLFAMAIALDKRTGATPSALVRIRTLARRYRNLAERFCNSRIDDQKAYAAFQRMESQIRDWAKYLLADRVEFNRDPRGSAVRIIQSDNQEWRL